ncbi:hypothetical protein QBC39DRAFT_27432 [Podospora conica]|nr:hypothetical protein QBC39DRAFT_27432 [Schizothecium conicum]
MATATEGALPALTLNGVGSPRQDDLQMEQAVQAIANPTPTLDLRADPDAQATVTDFLDFTEHLPSDMMRSLTLIGKLDQTHDDASRQLHDLTALWGQLPNMPPAERVNPVELRAQISENIHHAVSSRVFSHAEAIRMDENLNRHVVRARTILAKLETMHDNYPTVEEIDEKKSPVATSKSPQLSRIKMTPHPDGHKVRRARVPRITVPGEVLAPYELNYDAFSSGSESSSSEEGDENEEAAPAPSRATPGPPRIKVVKSGSRPPKAPKPPKPRSSIPPPPSHPGISTTAALAQQKPPPENVIIGSPDAPWGQLTGWELATLRKRMKKNAAWVPSDTMVARELSILGRGIDAFKMAKQKAEEEGRPFDGKMPEPIITETGEKHMPLGALPEPFANEEKALSNKGMKLNEAKKAKRKAMAELAAEDAEESARRFMDLAATLMSTSSSQPLPEATAKSAVAGKAKPAKKRKRDSVSEVDAERLKPTDGPGQQRPQFKRNKTETPVPPPQMNGTASQSGEGAAQNTQRAPVLVSTTPIPLPHHTQDHSITAKSVRSAAASPAPSSHAGQSGTVPPLKLPTIETPIPPPIHSPKKSTTPILPPIPRETRKSQAARTQEQPKEPAVTAPPESSSPLALSPPPLSPKPDPDEHSALSTGVQDAITTTIRRPPSRGTKAGSRPPSRGTKATSQEPHPSLAADRPRRASTARNTPAPEKPEAPARPSSRRSKRPAPGIISRTVSGGNSAVGKRKAAPRKKSARASTGGVVRKDSKSAAEVGGAGDADVEVDDEGNVIDQDEPRYCLCNRVSFGTMIQCDNDNCKHEWFHLECVELLDIPARTTKWYCPDCRKILNIGEKGEVSARGVKA